MRNKIASVIVLAALMAAGSLAWWYWAQRAPLAEAEEAVRNSLTDPDSAQFRNVVQINGGVCGEVNARNRMGGYVGYQWFKVANTGRRQLVMIDNEELPGYWKGVCADNLSALR